MCGIYCAYNYIGDYTYNTYNNYTHYIYTLLTRYLFPDLNPSMPARKGGDPSLPTALSCVLWHQTPGRPCLFTAYHVLAMISAMNSVITRKGKHHPDEGIPRAPIWSWDVSDMKKCLIFKGRMPHGP